MGWYPPQLVQEVVHPQYGSLNSGWLVLILRADCPLPLFDPKPPIHASFAGHPDLGFHVNLQISLRRCSALATFQHVLLTQEAAPGMMFYSVSKNIGMDYEEARHLSLDAVVRLDQVAVAFRRQATRKVTLVWLKKKEHPGQTAVLFTKGYFGTCFDPQPHVYVVLSFLGGGIPYFDTPT